MKPYVHAKTSARMWGGKPEDYLPVHDFLDSTKAHLPDMRHRAILHNSWGIYMAERLLGTTLTNSDGRVISVRDVAEQHVLDDLGTIPTLKDCLAEMPVTDLLGARLRTVRKIPMAD
jgi:hypothetical protein